jgi:putative CocE/NonD family hydrolase
MGRYAAICAALAAFLVVAPAYAQSDEATGQGDIPARFTPPDDVDFSRREADIPMRDGVTLHTVIIIPKGAVHSPILLTRTPYNAVARGFNAVSPHLGAAFGASDYADELMQTDFYIRVFQDARGKNKSGGDYVMTRPLIGPLNRSETDESTDSYDTIDWLVKNIPESNGKVGLIGISYDGFTTLMGLIDPHPALKVAVPISPMVDGWMGDDWFHKGAFRQDYALPYIYRHEASRDGKFIWPTAQYDEYSEYLDGVSAGHIAQQHGLNDLGFWQRVARHVTYDSFWQDQAMDKILGARGIRVPVMLVHSLWDQEDIYGAMAVYMALNARADSANKLYLVMGPWFHHQQRLDGSAIGPINFGQDSAAYFRHSILRPFLNHFLKDSTPLNDLAPVTVFETGSNIWRKLHSWPPSLKRGAQKFYLHNGGDLVVVKPPGGDSYTSYISDPAHPVPYRARPVIGGDAGEGDWQSWLVQDQRNAASRPDVISYSGPVLAAPLHVAGIPFANVLAKITGEDADFIVKIIDVYPDEGGRDPRLGGYQLMVSADILRGRYRNSFAEPAPVPRDQLETFRFSLPHVDHVFLPGHRVMVQIQSSWFPLYDRNPQNYVENIMFAEKKDFRAETISVNDGGINPSFVELPVIPAAP